MTAFSVSVTINSSPEIVNAALMNPDNFPYWQTDLEKFEVIKGEGGRAGAVAKLHYSRKGKKYIMEDRMLYCDPGKKYISEVSSEVILARVETTIIGKDGITEMTIRWSGQPVKFLLKIAMLFMKNTMIKQTQKELAIFKSLVEKAGSDFSK